MLPDFPKIKQKLAEATNQYLQNLIRQEPLLSQIRWEMHFEGNRMSSQTQEGYLDESDYQRFASEFQINREEVITKGPMAFVENIQNLADEMKKQQAKRLFEKMEEITSQTGNVVNGQGQTFNFDHFLKGLDTVQIDFDEQGNPYMPVMTTSPQMFAKIREEIPKWESNPEYNKRYEALIEKKRKEWHDRESHRKLVD